MSRRDARGAYLDQAAPAQSWLTTTVLAGAISLLAGGAGFVMPHVIGSDAVNGLSWESLTAPRSAKPNTKHSSSRRQAFIPFGDVVANLAEDRLTRHLQARITLLANSADEKLIAETLETNRALLLNWLISYLSDKSLDEVRGAAGVNRARRDIQDKFNSLLFADGSEKVRDVLFEEFTIR